MITSGDLFCGCGGASLGIQEAELKHLWAFDSDPKAVESFNLNVAPVAICQAIESVNWAELEPVDFLWGSPPCQGFSTAGRRRKDDPRNFLIWGFVWAVSVLRPKAFAMENVPGIGQGDWTQFPQWVKGALETLGYKVTVMKLNAADYGVPQIRKRVFWVGALSGYPQVPPPTHAKAPWDGLLPWVTVREALGIPIDSAAPMRRSNRNASGECERRFWEQAGVLLDIPSRPILVGNDKGTNPLRIRRVRSENSKANGPIAEVDNTPTPTMPGEPMFINNPANTMNADPYLVTGKRKRVEGKAVLTSMGERRYRRLTVEECLKLQGFPDGFKVVGNQTEQYRQVGNAVPPAMGRAIAAAVRRAVGA